MADRWWQTLPVDNGWFEQRREELTSKLATELWKTRGFPATPDRMVECMSAGIGYMELKQRWVLPLPNVHGHIHQAKCWRMYYGDQRKYRWMTAGGDHARENHAKRGEPIGRVWDLPWIDHDKDGNPRDWTMPDGQLQWLWWTAGEWDCLSARLGNLPATCLTIGESASAHTVNAQTLLVEFGGPEVAQQLLSKFKGIVICYDADEAGDKGAVLLAGALSELCDEIGINDLNSQWGGVRAVNLRESPWYSGASGWDFSDFVRAAKAGGGGGLAWLRSEAIKNPVGKQAIADQLGVDLETAMVSGQIFVAPSIKIVEVEDLIDGGIQYAKHMGSRAQGVFHMGLRAEDGGWTFDEMRDKNVHIGYLLRVNDPANGLAKDHGFSEAEFYTQLKSAMQGTRRPEHLNTDLANMIRLKQYYNFFRWHDIKGWLYWNGVGWESGRVKIFDHADRIPDKIDEEAAVFFANGDQETGKALKKWASACRRNVSRINTLIDMASKRGLFRPRSEIGQGWDNRPNLMGTSKGVLNLDTGEFVVGPEARDAYCSARTNGTLVNKHSLETGVSKCWQYWESLLEEWQPDPEVRRTLQELAGTCLYGRLDEHFYIFKSSGRSGKSTFMDALATAIGQYAYKLNSAILKSSAGDNARSSATAGLDSKRLVVVDEIGAGKLDIEVIKQLTGERVLSGRALRAEWSEVRNQGTYIGMANADLQWPEMSEALMGRLWQIDWPRSYVDPSRLDSEDNVIGVAEGKVRARDDRVKNICNGEDPEFPRMPDVVFTWMFEGWERVRDRGYIDVADSIRNVTNVVWSEADILAGYFGDKTIWMRGGKTLVSTEGLWTNMRDWATRNGDSGLFDALGEKPLVLSGILRTRASRGFESMGRVGKPAGALWMGDKTQAQAWIIPFTYNGPK